MIWGKSKTFWAMVVIVILHTVGLIAMLSPLKSLILPISWLNLLICGALAIALQPNPNLKYALWLGIAFLTGMITEVIGVNTGILFGEYHYLDNLGFKVAGVPLIIGVNWTYLVLGASSIAALLHANILIRTTLAATLMLSLDYLMEPVAIALDFWNWYGAPIPFKNYACWFGISWVLALIYFKWMPNNVNKTATLLYVVQVLFFAALQFSQFA